MSNTTSAIVHREAGGHSKLETITLEALRDDEALVEIHASGVCHTDLSCQDGVLPAQFPAVFGHEGAGIVLETGKAITNVKPGDKVLLSYAHCGGCAPCKTRQPAYCHQFMGLNFGGARADGTPTMTAAGDKCFGHFFGQSSFARKAVVHASALVGVAPDTPLELYAPLGCGLQTGAGAVLNTLDFKEGSTIAVFGVGSVGLAAVMAAKIRKASRIVVVDLQPARLELAKALGATDCIDAREGDVVKRIQAICPPVGVEYAVECTGVPSVVDTMVESLGTKGKGASVGAPAPGQKTSIDILVHLAMGRSYVGCIEGDSITSEFIPYLIEQHKKGTFPFEKFVTYYEAKDFEQAFSDMKNGKTIKAILKWS